MAQQYKIHLNGLVQGVGFRPFIYRLAKQMQLNGYVENCHNGINVVIETNDEDRNRFIARLQAESPRVAQIQSIVCNKIDRQKLPFDFLISPSTTQGIPTTTISPDIAVCDECLADIEKQPHRLGYPFVNCTLCGPRFSIVQSLPYDRDATTMKSFSMCQACHDEYHKVSDRRFHAQPIACNHCGPYYRAYIGKKVVTSYAQIIEKAVQILHQGKIIALKGIGGYALVCDATNEKAVLRLRMIKERSSKPLAVMFDSLKSIHTIARPNSKEQELLSSWQRPIVLLKVHAKMANHIHDDYQTLGCLLPYMPIHYHLFSKSSLTSLVYTSGNLGGDAILANDDEAKEKLFHQVDMMVVHNREIHNRVDDSLLQVVHHDAQVIRRARGYVPQPLSATSITSGILAFGAEQISSFAFAFEGKIIGNQYIGDLLNIENKKLYNESLSHFRSLYKIKPQAIACDLHPQYVSTQLAEKFAKEYDLPLYRVQHHYAHAQAVMTEFGIQEPVLALCLDGTGYGDDGHIWGGEILLCNENGYHRLDHLPYVAMPGGDVAAREPWRMSIAYCLANGLSKDDLPVGFVNSVGEEKITNITRMIQRDINSPLSSGAGRLFDSISALLGVCRYNSYSGEASNLLEQKARNVKSGYEINECNPFDLSPIFYHLLNDIRSGISVNEISGKFHYTFSYLLAHSLLHYSKKTGIRKIVLGGGVFQNKRLTELLFKQLNSSKVKLYISRQIPVNDAAIAYGQVGAVSLLIK